MEQTIWALVHVKHLEDLVIPLFHKFLPELNVPVPPLTEVQFIEKFTRADQMCESSSVTIRKTGKVGGKGVGRELSKTFLGRERAGVHAVEGRGWILEGDVQSWEGMNCETGEETSVR
jgi:hypothetical protein